MHGLAHVGVNLHAILHQPTGVQHRAVITTAKGLADGAERMLGELAAEEHGDLPREGDVFRPALAGHVSHAQVKFLRHFLLDHLDSDGVAAFFLQNLAQQVFHHVIGEILAGEVRVGGHANQRTLKAADIRADAVGEEGQYVLRNLHAHALHLVSQDGEAGFHIRRLQVRNETPLKAAHQTMLQVLNFTGRPIAGQHDLLVRFVQCIESVEELLLYPLLAGEKLDIINQQNLGLAVLLPELHELVVLNGSNVVVCEFLGGHIGNLCTFLVSRHMLAHCVKQMRFAKASTAVKEQRVVRLAWLLCHGHRSGMRKAIVVANNEGVEGVARIKDQVALAHLLGRRLLGAGRLRG